MVPLNSVNTLSASDGFELANAVGISVVNLSNLKTGKVKAIRFSTLDAICRILNCQPGDILEYTHSENDEE
ncbi:helix-turn-helix domain-containing protein [Bacillus albus]|uniref:helix-turn-helix domain-containing protein n=1 Tax=Bacillus albus TaxID=2026189 RepID=UPI003D246642